MRSRHLTLLAVLCLAAACGDDDGPGADSDPGSLVRVSVDSTVGVLLDDFPAASRERIATALLAQPDDFWEERVRRQLRLTAIRLVYRELYYDEAEMKRSLPLPPEEVWTITLDGAGPTRMTIDGHDLLAVGYTMESTLLSDLESPGLSEPALATIGGIWDEDFVFPVDPTLLLQRTGFACMDEEDFPLESVDAENAYAFYDDQCEVEVAGMQVCHLTTLPAESCVDAVAGAIGRVETSLRYERIAWNDATADLVRAGEVTLSDAPDLKVVTSGFQSLQNHRIVYKYFPAGHCAIVEGCVGGAGWRRLVAFDSIDHNVGAAPLHIGPVDYYNEGLGGELILHNVYEFSDCHEHFHFQHYGDFSFSGAGVSEVAKNGFCLESTGRLSNNETSPLHTPYDCENQGVSPGWVDLYAAGLTCNWIDVTGVDTSAGNVTGDLTFVSNPDGFMCEGALEADAQGNQIWEATAFTTAAGLPVDRPACAESAGAEGNDTGQVAITLPQRGGMVSGECTDAQSLGPRRNCDFTTGGISTCTPGATVTLSCTGGADDQPQVVRVCEASAVLNDALDCVFQDALANVVVEAAASTVTFTCPAMRDVTEPGGGYAVYTAPVFAPDGPRAITCVVP